MKIDKSQGEKNIVWEEGQVDFNDRCKNLKQEGHVIWFTGLSASGKSTISIEVEKQLLARKKAVYRLDGDNVRHGLCSDLGFSPEDRNENIRRIAETAALFKDAGLITLAAFISPYQESRDFARSRVGDDYFSEVYVRADVDTCARRDPKGFYEKAFQGEIENFTGVSAPYEEPHDPELVLDTTELGVQECVSRVLGLLEGRNHLQEVARAAN